jgi:hypothetical protein
MNPKWNVKYLKLFLFAIITLFLFSCKEKDVTVNVDTDNPDSERLQWFRDA